MNFWGNFVSKKILAGLNAVGAGLPFSLLEWGLAALLVWILLHPHRFRRFSALILTMLLAFALVWAPLYAKASPDYRVTRAQMLDSCAALIDTLNASEPDFSSVPKDLPAKTCAFPFWMRAFRLSGFYSFFTGEALIARDVPPCAAPFTAVHEAMHGRGIANEGACNIAAYEECTARGGTYADSAHLWALRYSMGAIRAADYEAYTRMLCRMNPDTYNLFREIGGAVPDSAGSYGILAAYLAAKGGV